MTEYNWNMIDNLQSFVEQVDNAKKQNLADLSSDQDLSIAIMNLISIEEHFFFSGAKTKKDKFYDMIEPIRQMRKELLEKIIKQYEGEVWCISKHLLASSMRLMEVGTKQQSMGNKAEAIDLFEKAYNLYCLFWGLNMKFDNINVDEVKNLAKKHIEDLAKTDLPEAKIEQKKSAMQCQSDSVSSKSSSMFDILGSKVKELLNCCRE